MLPCSGACHEGMEIASRGEKWWGRTALGTALGCWVANNGHCIEKNKESQGKTKRGGEICPRTPQQGPDANRPENAGDFAVCRNESKTGQIFANCEVRRHNKVLKLSLL